MREVLILGEKRPIKKNKLSSLQNFELSEQKLSLQGQTVGIQSDAKVVSLQRSSSIERLKKKYLFERSKSPYADIKKLSAS